MFNTGTDKQWEKSGKNDPYYGVLTLEKYRSVNLTEENKEEFFDSGYGHLDHILMKIERYIEQDFIIRKALDFGCGVGRLLVPLAEIAESVTGIDVSQAMLDEAKKNCEARAIKNASFLKSDDSILPLSGKYNFIHSFIVFQHIPVRRGECIFRNLLGLLDDGGVCVIHFTYAKARKIMEWVQWVTRCIPFAANTINLLKGKGFFAPQMQMNSYDLNRILSVIQNNGIPDFYAEYTNHGGSLGIILYFKKPEKA
ncbi:MAG: class I SAM-dependent methyltransferase [Pseudomonadota bacterium]